MKNIEGKVPYQLVPVEAMEQYALAMAYGAKKHKIDDWREGKGMPWCWLIAAILRHTFKVLAGEDFDKDSGLPHMAHVMASASMLLYYLTYKKRYDQDDRFTNDF